MKKAFLFLLMILLLPAFTFGQRQPKLYGREFQNKVSALRKFVRMFGRKRVNHLLVGVSANNTTGKFALYAYWKEDKSILILSHFDSSSVADNCWWLHHKARVKLQTDVVPTQEDVGGSTYLVDRAWVNDILRTCRRGKQIIIRLAAKSRWKC